MGTYGDLWGPRGALGNYGDPIVPYGDLWGPMGTLGDLWGPMGSFWDLWGHTGTNGDVWGPMGPFSVFWLFIFFHVLHVGLMFPNLFIYFIFFLGWGHQLFAHPF